MREVSKKVTNRLNGNETKSDGTFGDANNLLFRTSDDAVSRSIPVEVSYNASGASGILSCRENALRLTESAPIALRDTSRRNSSVTFFLRNN